MANDRVTMGELVNFDASTLTGTYQVIITATDDPAIAFKVGNTSDNLILFSYDGTTDHDFIQPGSAFIFDSQANAVPTASAPGRKMLKAGQKVWAKTSSATDRLLWATYLQ